MSTPETEQPVAPQDALAWEDRYRDRAGIAAIAAAVITLAANVAATFAYKGYPHVLLVDALRDAAGEAPPGAPGLKTAQILFYDDHTPALLAVAFFLALGSVLMVGILAFLYRAAAARTSRMPRVALWAAVAGPVMVALAGLVLQISVSIQASDFASAADQSTAAAHDAFQGGALVVSSLLRQLGVLVVGLAFVLVSLNAMRVGLLSRFMGILGIIAGVLFVIPIGSQLPIVQTFWLFAVGFLVMRRWPGGNLPNAWTTGKAEPWPSQQELREQRARDAGEAPPPRGGRAARAAKEPPAPPAPLPRPDEDAGDGTPEGTAHSSSKKKKRKRR